MNAVNLILGRSVGDLTQVLARVLGGDVRDPEAEAVVQTEAWVSDDHELVRRQHSAAPSPQQHVRPCNSTDFC